MSELKDIDVTSLKRFEECGFSQKNSCFVYDYDYLMNYIETTTDTLDVPQLTQEEIKSHLREIDAYFSGEIDTSLSNKTHLRPYLTSHVPSAVSIGAGMVKRKSKKSKKKKKKKKNKRKKITRKKSKKRNIKKTRKKNIKQSGGLVFFENDRDLEEKLSLILSSNYELHYNLFKEDLRTCVQGMSIYGILNQNLLKYFDDIERTMGEEGLYTILFGDIGGHVDSEDGGLKIEANKPELVIEFEFEKMMTNYRGKLTEGLMDKIRKRSARMKNEYDTPNIISFNNSKIKYPYSLDLCTLIVWWNWVLQIGKGTFCTTTNNILRGNITEPEKVSSYMFMRIILYKLLRYPWKGLRLAKQQISQDDPENKSLERVITTPEKDKYLYRSESYGDEGHWLIDQLRDNPKFQALKDNRTSVFESNEITNRVYVSQNGPFSTTYDEQFARSWVKNKTHKVIYTIKGAIDGNNNLVELFGSPWQIEFQGPTFQKEIVIGPCMYIIDSWSETRTMDSSTTEISIYIVRDLDSFILDRIINNLGDLDETIRGTIKEKLISFLRGKNYDLSSFDRDIQKILIYTKKRLEFSTALTNPELERIMIPTHEQKAGSFISYLKSRLSR